MTASPESPEAPAAAPAAGASHLVWEPPGRGTWDLLADHYPRPLSAALTPFMALWSQTSTEWMKAMGLPIRSATMASVHGLPYVGIDAGGGSRTPPGWVMRLAMRLVPSLRKAERQLSTLLEQRPWKAAFERWYSHERPAAVGRMLALAEVSLIDLDDRALATHLDACFDELLRSGREHLLFHAHDTMAPLLFVIRAMDLGMTKQDAFGLLTGGSPASTGRSPELSALRSAVRGRTAADLDELRGLDAGVAEALDCYLLHHGGRLVDGYDIDARTLGELPNLVVHLATALQDPTAPRPSGPGSAIPASARAELERELPDARTAYGVRDDNSGILIAWPTGLLRLAMLEAGRRLVAAGDLPRTELALEATVDELGAALRGAPIDAPTLEARDRQRGAVRAADAPRRLGPAPAAPPAGIPGAMGRVFRAFALFDEDDRSQTPMGGLGIGDRPYTGPVRIVTAGLDSGGGSAFQPGDVLVAPMTSPSYNVLLAAAGALVTEEGGYLSHAAIMARELGLPAVLGIADATRRFRDGEVVTVDPATGSITRHDATMAVGSSV